MVEVKILIEHFSLNSYYVLGPYMKLHFSGGARIRATTDDYCHETHEKTRNTILIFV